MVADQQLVAVVVRADPELSVMDLKRHCAARLPPAGLVNPEMSLSSM